MRKTYLAPALDISEATVVHMLAESLAISETTVNGSEALTKENMAWEIWNEE